jgi:hypothetical protein
MHSNNEQSLSKKLFFITKKIVGVLLIVTGIFGLVLPGLQGIAMITAGSLLLGHKKVFRYVTKRIKTLKTWWKQKKSGL